MTNGNSAERELFEEYMKKEHPMMPLDRHTDKDSIKFDEYRVNWIEDMWESWQARAALSVCADGGKDSSDAYVNPSDVTLTRHQKDELLKVAADMVTEGDEELAECLRALVVCAAIAKEKK